MTAVKKEYFIMNLSVVKFLCLAIKGIRFCILRRVQSLLKRLEGKLGLERSHFENLIGEATRCQVADYEIP